MENSLKHYTRVRNTQIVLSLLKKKGIKRVIVSPGTTNMSVVASMTNDPYFEMFSAPDERSAAYMACGMAAETGEPVIISCTGATASRNYLPALTEAFYRKLPIVALTSSLNIGMSGHLYPQFIDRTAQPVDCVKCSVQVHPVHDSQSEWECVMNVNKALLELTRSGGGPIHINLMTQGDMGDFSIERLPDVREIHRYTSLEKPMPEIPNGRIAVFVGSHFPMTKELESAIDLFCQRNNAIVLTDHTSSYYGAFKVQYAIAACQDWVDDNLDIDLLVHIGEISGDYYTLGKLRNTVKNVWRVSPDGEIRDYFRKLSIVFEMEEKEFFSYYSKGNVENNTYYEECVSTLNSLYSSLPTIPFSNIWIASQLYNKLPNNSVIHFAILNSLRSWNFFPLSNTIKRYSNVGGFGIDGPLSTIIGASLVHPEKLYFGIVGDLAFFYDMNSLGNRSVGQNLRILLVNNGKGTEFRNYTHPASKFGEIADMYIAAAGHYGNKSNVLVKHYAEDLGFIYLAASSKEQFIDVYHQFIDESINKSIIFEVFTNSSDESNALRLMRSIKQRSLTDKAIGKINHIVQNILK